LKPITGLVIGFFFHLPPGARAGGGADAEFGERHFGGCAILLSGTYFTEMPCSVLNTQGGVDGHDLDLLPEMESR
jgi:hypothetical protein